MRNNFSKWPDFFIVGAPKCGTTALSEYLKQHPDIYIPRIKEPHYFGSDLNFDYPPKVRSSQEEYLKLFEEAYSEQICGEASVMYLLSEKAAEEIKDKSPNAKIIIMLRNPVDLLYSLHSQMLYSGNEDIQDFEESLRAEKERKEGKRIPKLVRRYDLLKYSEVVNFYPQIRRYIEMFGVDNVLVLLYKNLKHNTVEQFQKVLTFLGLDNNLEPEYRIVNPNQSVRSNVLRDFQRMIMNSTYARRIGRKVFPRVFSWSLLRFMQSINTKPVARPPLPQETRVRLYQKYTRDIDELEQLLHVYLSHWRET